LDLDEVTALLSRIFKYEGVQVANSNIQEFAVQKFKEVDIDGSGFLEFDEFVKLFNILMSDEHIPKQTKETAMQSLMEEAQAHQKKKEEIKMRGLKKLFEEEDEDKSGELNKTEMRNLLRRLFGVANLDFEAKELQKYTLLNFGGSAAPLLFEDFAKLYDELMQDDDIAEELKYHAKYIIKGDEDRRLKRHKKKRRHSSKQFKSFIRQRAIPFEERVEAEWQAIKKKEEEIFILLEE